MFEKRTLPTGKDNFYHPSAPWRNTWPKSWPNSQLVEHADDLLERNGALIAVVDKAIQALDFQELWRRYIERMSRGE